MKNKLAPGLISILFFVLLAPNIIFSDTIKQTYLFDKPIIQKQNDGTDLIYFTDSYQMGIIGGPTFPMQKIALLLPPGQIATNVTINFLNLETIEQKINLSPKQYPRRSGELNQDVQFDQQLFNSAESIQISDIEAETHYFFGYSIVLATFSPVQYIPANQSLTYSTVVDVDVETEVNFHAVQALKNYRYAESIQRQLRNFVQNFENIFPEYSYQTFEPEYEYLIITIDDFIDDYQPLAQFYNERGLNTRIATVEHIYQTASGNDNQEKIRNYIIEQSQQKGISYVLLAGDADAAPEGQLQVPIRNFYCEALSGGSTYTSQIPTDLYYSALDGNWNNNGDDKWGEPDEDDLLPELFVARICADNSDEISALLNKIFTYQNQPVFADAEKVLLVGEHLWNDPLSFGSDYLDLLIGLRSDNGYTTQGIPTDFNFTYLYDRDIYPGSWSTSDLLTLMNNGSNFLHHLGHCNSRSCMRLQLADINNDNFYALNGVDHLNPVIYTEGCETAKIDAVNYGGEDCIAEKMLEIDNLASAIIGNTRYGWFNEGQTEGPSLHLHREFLSALYGKQIITLGAAHTESRIQTAPFVTAPNQWEPGALRWCFYGCNVFGDAAMAVWTNQISEFQNVTHPTIVSTNFEIETGVPDARVSLSANGDFVASVISNNSGTATFELDSTLTSSILKLTYTALNYKPYSEYINIQPNPTEVSLVEFKNNLNFELKPAYPNPFNPVTTIEFSLTKSSDVRLEVFNIAGQRVRTLIAQKMDAGVFNSNWDGQSDDGQTLANGIYLFRLATIEGTKVRQSVFLK